MSKEIDNHAYSQPFCCRRLEGGIRNRGMRMTIPRQLVAEVLENAEVYLSAEEIYSAIKNDYPAIGLATVYRTLVLLEDIGVVSRHNFGEGKDRYFAAEKSNEKRICQFVCEKCYRVMKFSNSLTEDFTLYQEIEEAIISDYGFNIKKQVTQFYGLCPDCNNKIEKGDKNEGSSCNS